MNSEQTDRLIRQRIKAFEQHDEVADTDTGLLWDKLQTRPLRRPMILRMKVLRWAAAVAVFAGIGILWMASTGDNNTDTTLANVVVAGYTVPEKEQPVIATTTKQNEDTTAVAVVQGVSISHSKNETLAKSPSMDDTADCLMTMDDPATAGLYAGFDIAITNDNLVDQNLICY